jgi:hypothetical protein
MLLSEHYRGAASPDCVDEPSGAAAAERPSPAAQALAEVREAIAALSAAASVHGPDPSDPREPALVVCAASLSARLASYQGALEVELTHHPAGERLARTRTVLRQHVAFALRGLIADLDALRAELRCHGEVAPVLRKTWCLALATSVAVEHLADDLARFRARSEGGR